MDHAKIAAEVVDLMLKRIVDPGSKTIRGSDFTQIPFRLLSAYSEMQSGGEDPDGDECDCGACKEVLRLSGALDAFLMGWCETVGFGEGDDALLVHVAANSLLRAVAHLKDFYPEHAPNVDELTMRVLFSKGEETLQ